MNQHCPLKDSSACKHAERKGVCQACHFDFETLDPDEGMFRLRRVNAESSFADYQQGEAEKQKANGDAALTAELQAKLAEPEKEATLAKRKAEKAEAEAEALRNKPPAQTPPPPLLPTAKPMAPLAAQIAIGAAFLVVLFWSKIPPAEDAGKKAFDSATALMKQEDMAGALKKSQEEAINTWRARATAAATSGEGANGVGQTRQSEAIEIDAASIEYMTAKHPLINSELQLLVKKKKILQATADAILGKNASSVEAIKSLQTALQLTPNGKFTKELLSKMIDVANS